MERETVERREAKGFGFPVVIHNAPVYHYGDRRALGIGSGALGNAVVRKLVTLSARWTGNQVKFVRAWFGESMADFGERVDVSDAAVAKWEGTEDEPTGMELGTEFMLRVLAAHELREEDVIDDRECNRLVHDALRFDPAADPYPVEIEGEPLELHPENDERQAAS